MDEVDGGDDGVDALHHLQLENAELKHKLAILEAKSGWGLKWKVEGEGCVSDIKDMNHIPVLNRYEPAQYNGQQFPLEGRGDDLQHTLIRGENYDSLISLAYSHGTDESRRFDIIYIDPPYNTEREDLAYNDTFVSPADDYRHSKWCEFMHNRLRLAKRLLRKDGFMAISIDYREQARLVLILEELFGVGSTKVVANQSATASGVAMKGVHDYGKLLKMHEYVVFVKRGGVKGLTPLFIPRPVTEIPTDYKSFLDDFPIEWKERIQHIEDRIDEGEEIPPEEIAALNEALEAATIRPIEDYGREWMEGNVWRIVRDSNGAWSNRNSERISAENPGNRKMIAAINPKSGKLVFVKRYPERGFTKGSRSEWMFLSPTHHPGDFWPGISTTALGNEGGVDFKAGKKPLELLDRIIARTTKPDARILDFFAGSGTLGEAVLRHNHHHGTRHTFVMVTNNDGRDEDKEWFPLCDDITFPRIAGTLTGTNPKRRPVKDALGNTVEGGYPGQLNLFEPVHFEWLSHRDSMAETLRYEFDGMIALREETHETVEEGDEYSIIQSTERVVVIWKGLDGEGLETVLIQADQSLDDRELVLYTFTYGGGNPIDEDMCENWRHARVEAFPWPMINNTKAVSR